VKAWLPWLCAGWYRHGRLSGSVALVLVSAAAAAHPPPSSPPPLLRALTHEKLEELQQRLEGLSVAVAAGFGCNASVDWKLDVHPYYPPTVNDPAAAAFAEGVAARCGPRHADDWHTVCCRSALHRPSPPPRGASGGRWLPAAEHAAPGALTAPLPARCRSLLGGSHKVTIAEPLMAGEQGCR
jgi:hypothetical protein